MLTIRDPAACAALHHGSVVALGNFDGVHRGHQAILRLAKSIADEKSAPLAVLTFEPHPRELLSGDRANLRLAPFRTKAQLLAAQGVDLLFVIRFNQAFAQKSPQAFIDEVLAQGIQASHIVTGYNFAFGQNRSGDTAFLAEQAERHGIGYTACQPLHDQTGRVISSSAIRQCLAQAQLEEAAHMLGRPYAITGRVQPGDKRGRTLGFPTANIAMKRLYKPRYGVYAARLRLEHEKTSYNAVANLGIRPSFGGKEALLEVHAFDADLPLYGKRLNIELIAFIREEQRFDGIESLKAQIGLDCQNARHALAEYAL